MNKLIIILLLSFPALAFSQACDCEASLKWVKQTFEKNDAGFSYVIKKKGITAYKKHNQEYFQKSKNISSNTECYELLRNWIRFFRKGHFGIRPLEQNKSNLKPDKAMKNWETVKVNEEKLRKYLENKNNVDYEGIWKLGPYTIGIQKINHQYKGYIIEANGSQWKRGQVKLTIDTNQSCTFYMGDYSAEKFPQAELLGNKYLNLGYITLERVFPKIEANPIIERYYKAISAEKPYLEQINDNTLLLRIPSFNSAQKKWIDAVISMNREKIHKTKNLIIDLRDNGGGSDRSFEKLLPVLYTNPIEVIGVELLSTPRNNQRIKNFMTHPKASSKFKAWAGKAYKKLVDNEGKYVNLEDNKASVTKFDTIYAYPQNVGILINGQNASTTEQFLLAARQSKKVKLFGQTTFGALDISYTYTAKSPKGDFELIYCLSKSLRIPEMTIDDKGIHPDYFIYNHVAKYKWIDFVTEKLK